ncbi:MAG: sulfite exporter TauE/SafE family protein [bacterium]|nr:sulfite exporter TauE/SafE family protein [bacterium]
MAELLGLTLLGVLYGTTICSLSCLPTLGPLLVGEGGGFRRGLGFGASFLSGKVVTYTLLGAVAAGIGGRLNIAGGLLRLVPGVVIVLTGLYLLLVQRSACPRKGHPRIRGVLPFFALGAATGIAPCAPLAAVMAIAAEAGSIPLGAASGFLFGIGLMLSPMILLGGGLAYLSRSINLEVESLRPWIRRIAGLLLLLNGAGSLIRAIR